ncbi:membrane-fusion protein [Methylobacterium sp. 4-46]|uniref:NHLP bacteriocin system secretion protein n=1 Tax=unclassified Methylobacterium TaxID=2615210 RepID=UPI000152DB40|nr:MULTISPECIES: NHLP bacteriocin system secretion protein [Methylobacterium]ACA14678.1 membrane-fusion protein [Methylobacterium sp. 4-46]WFT80431.1 NHLP bacteriocin system secretion protein [Methylobacterium nodulans]
MSSSPQRAFRPIALERAASPEQLDHLVRITKPADWILAGTVALLLVSALTWSVVGRVPTRAAGEGILVSVGGRVVDAVSAASGRLAAIEVAAGDRVVQGQPVARIAQTDIEERHRAAVEVHREREREHATLRAKVKDELAAKARNFAKLEEAFDQIVHATDQRIEYLSTEVRNLETLLGKGITTRRVVEDRRRELTEARQRREDAQNEVLKLRTQKTDLETQRERELQDSQFRLNDTRRQMEQLAGELGRNTQVLSPIDGRVLEVKVSPGSVLTVGMPVIAVESEGKALEAVVYIPADKGKTVKPGMETRLEPSTVKREEYGTLVGSVVSISDFPITPQGMAAVLHNDRLVSRFSQEGAPYAALVRLQPDPATASGYAWAVGRGPDLRLTSGTLVRAEITTRQHRPLDLVVPMLKRLTGLAG